MSSQALMPRISAVKAGKGDSTLIGISKAYQTGTTAITSNPDNFSVTQTGMNASIHPQTQMFGTNSHTEILNYPYAYD